MPLQQKKQAGERSLRVSSRITPQITKYYLKVSRQYRTACAVCIVLLLVYLVFIIGTFGEYITYDNMQYLLRDLDSMVSTGDSEFSQIQYRKQNNQTFAVFKNGLASAGKEYVSLFDSSGLLLCEDTVSMNDPVLVPSEKYLLVYDLGGYGYAVYNSITRVVSRSTDHRIMGGDMSDSGAFILITRSSETKYVVEHYNTALSQTMSIYKDNYVMDAAISRDGKRVAVCSAVPAETDFNCEIALYTAGSSEVHNMIILNRTMPLSVYAAEDGFVVLCDNGLYFYDTDGTKVSEYLTSGMTLEYADFSDRFTVLAGSENALGSENRICVFGKDGSLLYDRLHRERITGVCAAADKSGDTLAYLLTPEKIIRLAETADGEEPVTEEADIREDDVIDVCAAGNGAIACTSTGAYYLFK